MNCTNETNRTNEREKPLLSRPSKEYQWNNRFSFASLTDNAIWRYEGRVSKELEEEEKTSDERSEILQRIPPTILDVKNPVLETAYRLSVSGSHNDSHSSRDMQQVLSFRHRVTRKKTNLFINNNSKKQWKIMEVSKI